MPIFVHRTIVAAIAALLALCSAACSSGTRPTGPSEPSVPSAAGPPASAGHSLVYADHVGMVVLVNAGLGGASPPSASTPTRVWGWTGSEWRLLDSSGPPVRNLAGVAYDRRRQVLVMHGGSYDLGRMYGETWEWSGGWRQVTASGPGVRDHTQLAYDADRGRAVLFGGGGQDPAVAFGDTWEFDGTSWTRVATDGPAARVHHAMQFDPLAHRVVLFGGVIPGGGLASDSWAWDGVRWTPLGSIAPRSHARMAFHRRLGALVVAGGEPAAGLGLLVNRGGTWMSLGTASDPGARVLPDIAYDERRDVLVLFGGAAGGSTLLDDTWEFDGMAWRRAAGSGGRGLSQMPTAFRD